MILNQDYNNQQSYSGYDDHGDFYYEDYKNTQDADNIQEQNPFNDDIAQSSFLTESAGQWLFYIFAFCIIYHKYDSKNKYLTEYFTNISKKGKPNRQIEEFKSTNRHIE